MRKFEASYEVRFQHCDPAGMVFYPRYYELLSCAVEDYFKGAIEISHHELVRNNLGIPMRHIELEFLKPTFLGDVITYALEVIKYGASSIKFKVDILSEQGERRASGIFTVVFVCVSTKRPVAIPDQVRKKIALFDDAE